MIDLCSYPLLSKTLVILSVDSGIDCDELVEGLNDLEFLPESHLVEAEEALSTLSSDDLETFVCGDEVRMNEIIATGSCYLSWWSDILNSLFFRYDTL